MTRTPVSLLDRLREPTDLDAWDRFVQLVTPLLFYWGRSIGLQEQDAADLAQDVLVTLYKKMPSFEYKPGKSFRAWLRTVTLNHWRNHAQKRSPELLADMGDREDAGPDPARMLEEAEYRQHLVKRALRIMQADFEPTTWRACWEIVVGDREAGDIAKSLGITVGAVYAAKFRVLQRLRRDLAGLWD